MNLFIFKHNNYYNRIYKKFNTISAYQNSAEMVYYLTGVNFNPNDGVNTNHVIGQNGGPSNDYREYSGEGDYVVITDVVNGVEEIISRWFIIEVRRTMRGQYSMQLRRDLLADYHDQVVSAPVFIEKATLSINDDLIFNREDMTYNQVKTKELLLKDVTGSAWAVGYLARSLNEDKEITVYPNVQYDYGAPSLEEFEGYKYTEDYTDAPKKYLTQNIVYSYRVSRSSNNTFRTAQYAINDYSSKYSYTTDLNSSYYINSGYSIYNADDKLYTLFNRWKLSANFANPLQNSDLSSIKKFDKKVLKVGSEDNVAYYLINVVSKNINKIESVPYTNSIYDETLNSSNIFGSIPNPYGIYGINNVEIYYLTYQDITSTYSEMYSFTLPASRTRLQDAPYDMFCLPISSITLGGEVYSGDNTNEIINNIFTQLTDANVYDIQLLPYCPMPGIESIIEGGLSGLTEEKDYVLINRTDSQNIIFFPEQSSFSTIINISQNSINNPDNNIEFKVASECDMYRLCSPNYNGVFEFSAVRNGGVSYFEVNATYKPYTPYIHVNPNFGRLYGGDFNDNRGLILGGDFSIAAVSSAWAQYELQNKNYQKVFDRQIQNMEVQNNAQRIKEYFSVGAGTAQGAMSGAMTAALSTGGNPYAAAAGAVVGGAASLAGGIADIVINEQLRAEGIDYAKDNFGYSLGNIKALPYSLSKSSAFDINSKIFPFLEYYTATDTEKEALRLKIKYNGMTVMRIGTISDYVRPNEQTFIKGQLIRLEGLNDEFHLIKEISAEINKGVFI